MAVSDVPLAFTGCVQHARRLTLLTGAQLQPQHELPNFRLFSPKQTMNPPYVLAFETNL